jgi:hypothetical protein
MVTLSNSFEMPLGHIQAPEILENNKGEIYGELLGVVPASKRLLSVQIGARYVLMPVSMRAKLAELQGRRVAVTMIQNKHRLRVI